MFDNIGVDPDEEARKREAKSALITMISLGSIAAAVVGVGMWTAKEVILDALDEEDLIELVMEDASEDMEAPPPPPPPPPPPAAAPDEEEEEEEEEEQEPEPEDMVEEIQELDEKVEEKMRSEDRPAGVEGGIEGGVVGGEMGGVIGGVEGGVVGGQLGPKIFHHSELEVKRRSELRYPPAAKGLGLGEQRCKVTVFIDESGAPYSTKVDDCPKVFHDEAKSGLMKWRWYPPKDGKLKVRAQTVIVVRFREQ